MRGAGEGPRRLYFLCCLAGASGVAVPSAYAALQKAAGARTHFESFPPFRSVFYVIAAELQAHLEPCFLQSSSDHALA